MAATKKGTTGKKAGAGAGKSKTQAKGVAKTTKAAPAAAKKAAASKPAAAPAATVKKTAAVKLNDRQREVLGRIKSAGESGYDAPKAEQRTIDALAERKLVKKGAKNKETGKAPYLVTKAGEKHLPAAPPAAAPSMPPAPPSPEQAASV